MRRRIEIIAFERERIIRHSVVADCPVCDSQTELLTVGQAAALAQVELHSIYRWLAEGSLHAATTPGGHQRVCRNSLFRLL